MYQEIFFSIIFVLTRIISYAIEIAHLHIVHKWSPVGTYCFYCFAFLGCIIGNLIWFLKVKRDLEYLNLEDLAILSPHSAWFIGMTVLLVGVIADCLFWYGKVIIAVPIVMGVLMLIIGIIDIAV